MKSNLHRILHCRPSQSETDITLTSATQETTARRCCLIPHEFVSAFCFHRFWVHICTRSHRCPIDCIQLELEHSSIYNGTVIECGYWASATLAIGADTFRYMLISNRNSIDHPILSLMHLMNDRVGIVMCIVH